MSGISGLLSSLDISASGLRAERQRMDVVMSNLANVSSTRTPEGGPYKRRQVVFEPMLADAMERGEFSGAGVQVAEVTTDASPSIRVYRPGHPDADADGYVYFPDIKVSEEMVDLMTAARSYEANSEAFKIARGMFQRALELGRS